MLVLMPHWYVMNISMPFIFKMSLKHWSLQCEIAELHSPNTEAGTFYCSLIPDITNILIRGVCIVWHFHVRDGYATFFGHSFSSCPDILCPVTKCSLSVFIKMSVGFVLLDTPFIPAFWHLSELRSNSCDNQCPPGYIAVAHITQPQRNTVKNKSFPVPLDPFFEVFPRFQLELWNSNSY